MHCYNHWHVTTKWMGSTITPVAFSYILTVKERYNPVDYCCMWIIDEIRFFFFDVEDAAHNQKLCVKIMRKLKIKLS